MPRIRFTLARLMAVIGLVALDLTLLRQAGPMRQGSVKELFTFGSLPALNLLIAAVALLIDRLHERGRVASFLVGFIYGTGLASLAFMTLSALLPSVVISLGDAIVYPVEYGTLRLDGVLPLPVADLIVMILIALGYAFPQVMVGVALGAACRVYRVGLVVDGREEATPGGEGPRTPDGEGTQAGTMFRSTWPGR